MKKDYRYKTHFNRMKCYLSRSQPWYTKPLHNDCIRCLYQLRHLTKDAKKWYVIRLIHTRFYGVFGINDFHDINSYRKNNMPYSILMSEVL